MFKKSCGEVMVGGRACHIVVAESLRKARKILKFCIEVHCLNKINGKIY